MTTPDMRSKATLKLDQLKAQEITASEIALDDDDEAALPIIAVKIKPHLIEAQIKSKNTFKDKYSTLKNIIPSKNTSRWNKIIDTEVSSNNGQTATSRLQS